MTLLSAAPTAPQKPLLPPVALGVAIVSPCFPCLWPVGLVLAIVAVVTTRRPPQLRRRIAMAALAVSGAGLLIIGLQVAIAIPNFIKFQARHKQAECKEALPEIYGTAAAYLQQEGRVGTLDEMGLRVETRNRYAYVLELPQNFVPVDARFAALKGATLRKALEGAGVWTGVQGECPDCTLTVACVGDVDSDSTLDVWSISSARRRDAKGATVAPGALLHHVDDVAR